MKLSDKELSDLLESCLKEKNRLKIGYDVGVSVPTTQLESILRELQDLRSDLNFKESYWEEEFLKENGGESTEYEINGVKYYKGGWKEVK